MLKIPPDWGTFCALIVSFLVFWFIFKRLFFDPFLKLIAERERKLRNMAERTEQLLGEEKAANAERARQLAGVRAQALSERETQRRQAEEEAGKVVEDARLAARDSLEEVRKEIEEQLRAAEAQLDDLGEGLAVELAERVLGRSLRGGPQMHSNN